MALLPDGKEIATRAITTVAAPVMISRLSTETMSAKGPKIAIPNGIETDITIPTNPNTRP
jgi:hypothetical protein